MSDELNNTLKPQRSAQVQSFEQRNRELLNKLSEQSRQIKLNEQQKQSDPSRVLERNFSLYNSGANASKSAARAKSTSKSVYRWASPQTQNAAASESQAYQHNDTLYPSQSNLLLRHDEGDYGLGRQDELNTLRLSQSLNYEDLEGAGEYGQFGVQNKNYDSRDIVLPEQVAPMESLFTIDVEGREIPVGSAIERGISGFMPVEAKHVLDHSDHPESIIDAASAFGKVDDSQDLLPERVDEQYASMGYNSTHNTEFGEIIPEQNTYEVYHGQSSFRMVSIYADDADGLTPAQIPESLLQLMEAIDQLPQRFSTPKNEKTQLILTDYYYQQRKSDSFVENEEGKLATLKIDEPQDLQYFHENDLYGKHLIYPSKAIEDSLYRRSIQLYESLTLKGMDSKSLAQQLQLLSPYERQCLLKQIIEIDEDQQTRRPKIKDISKPPPKIHLDRYKMITPKQLACPSMKQEIQSGHPPYIIKERQENLDVPASRSISRRNTTMIMVIQLLSMYDASDVQGTILPQLFSTEKVPQFTAIVDYGGTYYLVQLTSYRTILQYLPTADYPLLILCAFSQTSKYVLQQDQRKGRMRVAMPRNFAALVYEVEAVYNDLLPLFTHYIHTKVFPGKHTCALECESQLPLTNNYLSSNELVFKATYKRPSTPFRVKIPRPNGEYDVIEVHLLTGHDGSQVAISGLYVFDSIGGLIEDTVITANNYTKDSLSSLSSGGYFLSKYSTAVIYIQVKKGVAKIIKIANCCENYCACKEFLIKFNLKLVKEGLMEIGAVYDVILVADLPVQPILSQSRADNVAGIISPGKSSNLNQFPYHDSMSSSTVAKSRVSLQQSGLKVVSWEDLTFTIVFLATYDDSATAFELGNIALLTDKSEVLWPREVYATGYKFDFDLRGDRAAYDVRVSVGEHTDLSASLITANYWGKIPKNCCFRVQIWFSIPTEHTEYISTLLINNYAAQPQNQIRQMMYAINGVLQYAPPGVFLPVNQLSAVCYCGAQPYRNKAIQQDFLQKNEHFCQILLKQQLPKSASEFQKYAQQSDDFFEYVQTRAAILPKRGGRNYLQLNILHFKQGEANIAYATYFYPAGWSLKVDILSYHNENGELSFDFFQIVTNSNYILDYVAMDVVFSSSLQNYLIQVGAGQISDSDSSAQNLSRYMPWKVQFNGLSGRYEAGFQADRSLCSLCIRFRERQEISALYFVAVNVAEMSISMDGRLLIDCTAADTSDIQAVYFCKAKASYRQVSLL